MVVMCSACYQLYFEKGFHRLLQLVDRAKVRFGLG